MKKFLSITVAASLMAAAVTAFAADKAKGEPDVFVDGSKIMFNDQNAVIVDDITLVPARGVFEAMGNKVDWDGDARKVTVTSSTGVREVFLNIDSDVMIVRTFKTIFERESKEVKLEVPAKIMNERTMIPLRAVAEAFDCNVSWDGDAYKVDIKTGEPILLEGYTAPEKDEDKMVGMSLSTDADTVAAGEEFTVYIDAKNIPSTSFVSGVIAVFEYDKDKFEYVSGSGALLGNDDEKTNEALSAENTEFDTGTKTFFVMIEEKEARDKDGHVFRATFKKLTDGEGSIKLGNNYSMEHGYESHLMFTLKGEYAEGKEDIDTIYEGNNLALDTSPITIK